MTGIYFVVCVEGTVYIIEWVLHYYAAQVIINDNDVQGLYNCFY